MVRPGATLKYTNAVLVYGRCLFNQHDQPGKDIKVTMYQDQTVHSRDTAAGNYAAELPYTLRGFTVLTVFIMRVEG